MQDLNDKNTGNDLSAAEWNQLPSEIQNVIEKTGQALSGGDLDQLGKGMAQYVANGRFYTDSGAADAYVLTPLNSKQSPASYTNQMSIEFIPANTNAGSSTVNVNGLGVKNISSTAGGGELVSGSRYELRYNTGTGEFDIQSTSESTQIAPITATVSANALTLGLSDIVLDFRNASLTSGIPNTRQTGVLSLVVPSGAEMGTVDTKESRMILLALDNAGTVELAVVNVTGGVNLDETNLITTVAIDATADADNVIYSTTARVNVPFRVVGFIDSTQATAGTWATAPSKMQGVGGNALTAMSSLGYGQKMVAVTRINGTKYYNTTGKPIFFSTGRVIMVPSTTAQVTMSINGGTFFQIAGGQSTGVPNDVGFCIIPPGAQYELSFAGITSINPWELR